MTIRSILVPTDFSDLATAALRTAGTVPRATGASITALYADTFLPPPHFTSAQVGALAESIEASRTSAAHALEAAPPSISPLPWRRRSAAASGCFTWVREAPPPVGRVTSNRSPARASRSSARNSRAAPREVILRAAQERPTVIVIGVEHKRFRDTTVLGTRAVRVLRHAEAPVIAVPRVPAGTER